jgi:predicted dehydrogenase
VANEGELPSSDAVDRSGDAKAGTIRIAILGCGFIGNIHSFALRSLVRGGLADAAVVATCDLDLEKAKQMIKPHGGGLATDDVDEALAGADAAWVCTPTAMHRFAVERCVANGVAVYCEKPLAKDLEGAEAIARLVRDANIGNQVGLVLRFAPPFHSIASLCQGQDVEGGPPAAALGSPMAAVLRDDQFFPVGGMYGSDWRADVEVAGGGTLIEHSIHDVDVLTWMLGPVVSVSARTANHAGNPGIEDVAAVTFEHSSGAFSTLLSVWHGLESRPSTRRLEVFFEKAHAVLENEQVGPLVIEHAGGTTEVGLPSAAVSVMDHLAANSELKPLIYPYAASDLEFLRSIATGSLSVPGLDVAVQAHRVVDAAYRSAASGGAPILISP